MMSENAKKRKIIYISGTRADYGLMREVLFSIRKNQKLAIELVVSGMHLMPEFGRTIKQIKKDGFRIHQIKATYLEDNKESMVGFLGEFILGLAKKIKQVKPDIILVMGDRTEMLGGAIVGAYLNIPVGHIHGGEVTSTVDETARHSITKLSHLHFPATKKAAERILKMGEDKHRVCLVGAPGLDDIFNKKLLSKREICHKLNLRQDKPIFLVLQHPVSLEIDNAGRQIKQTLEAALDKAKEIKGQIVVIYPNADAGGRRMIKVIERYQKYPLLRLYKSLTRDLYLSLMKNADVLIGNSSSGLIEAPSLKLPAVNVGTRQEGRERTINVIDVGYNKKEIKKAITRALSKTFQKKLKNCQNPYDQGGAAKKITNFLAKIKIDKKLLDKKISY